ncbi:ROK family protein [Bradyrhizobium sp. CB1717]|uniref:ROK family protein n=1 Tax=Bradyrhizobium sp. CB1717 TaxID=3039154 RepID=UPI0024B1C6E6|nr:ROK family protein [Bradyrhizobium sp. CB1717]WFU25480.1 ROK family protein [Bradyrhizobium sp. CB1717]
MTLRFSLDGHLASPIVVFDLGGTWFRSAIAEPCGRISNIRSRTAISCASEPARTVALLQADLVEYVINDVAARRSSRGDLGNQVAIALGAALDQRTGVVWNSGPLWGASSEPFDLPAALRRKVPGIEWNVVNDVTAALVAQLRRANTISNGTTVFVTISTGIAARSWSTALGGIPVDGLVGLQGEIGHVPVSCVFRETIIHNRCGCGGADHLNAFSSGRGINALLRTLSQAYPDVAAMLGNAIDPQPTRAFAMALRRQCPVAREILTMVVDPLARVLLTALAMDPTISRVFLGGGVVDGIGRSRYLAALTAQLKAYGAYQKTEHCPRFFELLLQAVDARDLGLAGAAYAMQTALNRIGNVIAMGHHAPT